MSTFNIHGTALSVTGTPARIQLALETLFHLFPKTRKRANLYLEGRAVYNNNIDEALPKWLLEQITDLPIGAEPKMFFGPQTQIATIAIYNGLFFSAWTSEKNSNRIQFCCGLQNHPLRGIFQPVLIPLLREYFISLKGLLLHSASVMCPNGIGLLFIALSGGGKTTTALSLIRKGAKLLSDDLVIVQNLPSAVIAYGVPELLNLTDETIHFFEETKKFSHIPKKNSAYLKKSIPPQQIYGPNCLKDQCQLHVIYFIKVTKKGPSIRPLPAAEALEKLIHSHLFCHNQSINSFSISQLCTVLNQIKAYELSTGPDPKKLGEWLMTYCSDHAKI